MCLSLFVLYVLWFRASDLVMKVDSLLSSQPKGEARIEHTFAEDKYRYVTSSHTRTSLNPQNSVINFFLSISLHSAVKIRPKEEEVYFDVVAVLDPVTKGAQKLAPLLLVRTSVHLYLTWLIQVGHVEPEDLYTESTSRGRTGSC